LGGHIWVCGTSRSQKQNRHFNYLSKNRTI
jgi:hypothetical protein